MSVCISQRICSTITYSHGSSIFAAFHHCTEAGKPGSFCVVSTAVHTQVPFLTLLWYSEFLHGSFLAKLADVVELTCLVHWQHGEIQLSADGLWQRPFPWYLIEQYLVLTSTKELENQKILIHTFECTRWVKKIKQSMATYGCKCYVER